MDTAIRSGQTLGPKPIWPAFGLSLERGQPSQVHGWPITRNFHVVSISEALLNWIRTPALEIASTKTQHCSNVSMAEKRISGKASL